MYIYETKSIKYIYEHALLFVHLLTHKTQLLSVLSQWNSLLTYEIPAKIILGSYF